jgi:probable F420-dependent oxidoreductase
MNIGFVIILAELKALGRAHSYVEIREMALAAEAHGFDSLWLYDHLLYRPEGQSTVGIWECWTMLAALAEATQRVELGSLVLCNAFRNPAILAKMAHTLDEVSGGRFILGVGAGWNKPEYDAFGLPFDHRVSRFEEAIQIIRPLLREGRVDFSGTYYQARDCEIAPRGPRPHGPPLMIAGDGPRMLRLAAQYADLWNTAYLTGSDSLAEPRARLDAACAETGRDPATLGVTALVALNYPDLGEPGGSIADWLSGSADQIAETMRGYERLGVTHLQFHCAPYNMAVLERLAEALRLYRGS